MAVGKIRLEQVATASEVAVQLSAVDYTPATGRVCEILTIRVFNNDTTDRYCKIKIGATYITGTGKIPAQDCLIIRNVNEFLVATEKIYIQGEVTANLQVRISGLEVDA